MRRFLIALLFLPMFLLLPQQSFAQGKGICPPGQFGGLCNIKVDGNGAKLFGNVVTVLLILAIVVCMFFLIMGGIKWMTSGGDQAKVAAARSHIIAAIIGLVIALGAYSLVELILFFVMGTGYSGIAIPKLVPK